MSTAQATTAQLKSCIVHNEDATRCGCSLEVSQADEHRTTQIVDELPFIAGLAGDERYGEEGPWEITWTTKRDVFQSRGRCFPSMRTEATCRKLS